ncbi:MAG: MEMO1 family protein [Euryarchaeota archaeon]|nr:MEMO1 family protein [Euryarchaeota archaeon]
MRRPSVAGQFYAPDAAGLRKQIEGCFLHRLGLGRLPKAEDKERDILGAVVPHAGYVYSGPEAAHVYYSIAGQKKPKTVVILGPNHSGYGSAVAVSKESWKTPLGEAAIDSEAADFLRKNCDIIDADEVAHRYEHSIEVQLPFLQYIYRDFKFVPICIGIQDLNTSEEIAQCLGKIKDALILASSDFTHYEPKEQAAAKDNKAIEHILNLDEKKFLQTVYDLDISICGYGPIATCIAAVKKLGATKAELLKYATSGDITGDDSSVVAYAAIVFKK